VLDAEEFLEKVNDIGLNLTKKEGQAMLSVLSKENPTGKISVRDLVIILDTFGVPEWIDTENSKWDNMNKKKGKKPLNYEGLSAGSLRIMGLFTDYLLDSDTSVYEFFDG